MTVTYCRPRSLSQACEELADPDSFVLAGGVSLVLLMNTGFVFPDKLVLLDGIADLRGVRLDGEVVDVGAMCTHAELAKDPLVVGHLGAASEAFGRIGNVRVRGAGTIGGNLAHADPAQDPQVVLSTLGATVVVSGGGGVREIPIDSLSDGVFSTVLADDEIITRIRVPVVARGAGSAYVKFLPNSADDYATVSVATTVAMDAQGVVTSATLALGAVGRVTVAAHDAAALMVGSRPEDDVIDAVCHAVRDVVDPADDARGSADYKRAMSAVITARALRQAIGAAST